jgi:hypothetical protein
MKNKEKSVSPSDEIPHPPRLVSSLIGIIQSTTLTHHYPILGMWNQICHQFAAGWVAARFRILIHFHSRSHWMIQRPKSVTLSPQTATAAAAAKKQN